MEHRRARTPNMGAVTDRIPQVEQGLRSQVRTPDKGRSSRPLSGGKAAVPAALQVPAREHPRRSAPAGVDPKLRRAQRCDTLVWSAHGVLE